MNNKVLQLLEYNKIIALLSAQAGSALARERIGAFSPMTNERMVREALTETTEAVSVILYKGSLPIGEIGDLRQLLALAAKGRSLRMRELLAVRRSLAGAREVKNFLSSDAPPVPVMEEMASLLVTLPRLEQDITRCILSEEEVADNASPELKAIRRDIRNKNEGIRSRLNRYTSGGAGKYLQDAIVTMRNGRYVVPVKKEYLSMVPGMVHDQSQSGATLFVEPQAVVTLNNELKALSLAEEAEIERILQRLTNAVAEHRHDLHNNQELLVKLDVINAKGKLSCQMDGTAPSLNSEGRISIRGGRHPLIQSDRVVPIDVRLGIDFKTLLITGPNTGGKTVTLKTIGLFLLMAASGLHIPCHAESEIPIFEEIYADIGDEQSIEQSLSTFSSHMVNVSEILRRADGRSLVLLDELCAGTDPAEGAALGIAVLEQLRRLGAYVAATTHYTELKKYALSTEEVENASMEFDVETLSPTYRLRIGLPGKSNAFEISQKLGIHKDIIARAADLLGQNALAFEQAVARVEEDKKRSEQMLAEAEAMKRSSEELLLRAERKMAKTEEKRESVLAEARAEAQAIVREAHETVDEVNKELREAARERGGNHGVRAVAESRRKLREAERKHQKETVPQQTVAPAPEKLVPGTRVKLISLGQNGEVETPPDEHGNLRVRIGALKMNAKVRDLMLIEGEKSGNKERKRRAYAGISAGKAKAISPSLKVIGMNLEDASMVVDKYLDDAFLAGLRRVSIIHGRGTGILRDGLRQRLKSNKNVKSLQGAPYDQGGEGVTLVELKARK